MFSRRSFLQKSSLVSLAPVLPSVLARTARASEPEADDRVLVVIQMDGGNDGLNTVVPFGCDGYHKARKKLRLSEDRIHKIDEHVGLHPSMTAARSLFDDGNFSIVQGVGYPNPDRSHFRSMKIWQTASFDDDQHDANGWLGRAMDGKSFSGKKSAIYVGTQDTPVALWGRRSEAISLSREEDLKLAGEPVTKNTNPGGQTDLQQFVSKAVLGAYQSADDFKSQRRLHKSDSKYPGTRLATQLNLISKLLKSGTQSRIFYTSQSGYDTHAAQLLSHSRLLRDYSNALKAFLDDLKAAGLDDRVCVLTFSEFGRQVVENQSAGTDHGTAGLVFLAGTPVKGGLLGDAPELDRLDGDDLKMQFDFREIYSAILNDWLDVEPEMILGERFDNLELFS